MDNCRSDCRAYWRIDGFRSTIHRLLQVVVPPGHSDKMRGEKEPVGSALQKLRGLPHLIYLCARYIGADGRKVVAGIRHSRVILQGRRLPAPITYIGGCPTTGCSLFYFPVIRHVHLDSFHHAPRLCSVDNRSLVLKIRMYDNLNHTARLIGMRIDINQHFAVGVFVDV